MPSDLITGESSYALMGMAGIVSGVMQAPLTSVFLVLEITNGYHAVMHIMIVTFLSSMLTHAFEPSSFYFKDLVEKGQLLRPKTDEKILADINPSELIHKELTRVSPQMTVKDFINTLTNTYQTQIPIVDTETGKFNGMIDVTSARASIFDPDHQHEHIEDIEIDRNTPTVQDSMGAAEIIEIMNQSGKRILPVMHGDEFIGVIAKEDILSAYRGELKSYGEKDHLF